MTSGKGGLTVRLVVIRLAGFERFIEAFSRLPPDAPPDRGRMAALVQEFGLEFLEESRP